MPPTDTTVGLQNTNDCTAGWALASVNTDGTNTIAAADNDYYQFSPVATLQGLYTVGGATPDFPNISNMGALLGCGISGRGGSGRDRDLHGAGRIPVAGVSATDTVWIHSQSGDSTDVLWTYPSNLDASKNYLLFLDGADYVTTKG